MAKLKNQFNTQSCLTCYERTPSVCISWNCYSTIRHSAQGFASQIHFLGKNRSFIILL